MNLSIESICPRCGHLLAIVHVGAEHWHASILACPETYCDYVLVLGQREPVTARCGVDDRLRVAG